MEGEDGMIISIKMVDGSRIDVLASDDFKKTLVGSIMSGKGEWFNVLNDGKEDVYLRSNNIVSITIKGDGDDSKTIP